MSLRHPVALSYASGFWIFIFVYSYVCARVCAYIYIYLRVCMCIYVLYVHLYIYTVCGQQIRKLAGSVVRTNNLDM